MRNVVRAVHLCATVAFDGLVCVLTVSGELDLLATGKYADVAAAALRTGPERFVLDLSALEFVDCRGARALAATVQAVPDGCPVIARSVSPAAHRVLELLGLSLEHPGVTPGSPVPPPGPELQQLCASADQTREESHRLAHTVAATQDRVADTLIRLAGRSPQRADQLAALSQLARTRAAHFRRQVIPVQLPASTGDQRARRRCPDCGTGLD